jgi:hypothetical protein
MSHDRGWRAACVLTIWIPEFHFGVGEKARGVTAMVVGSGALLGPFEFMDRWTKSSKKKNSIKISGITCGQNIAVDIDD